MRFRSIFGSWRGGGVVSFRVCSRSDIHRLLRFIILAGNVPSVIDNFKLSERIAILLNETADVQATVSKYGYRYYTSIEEFKEYITSTFA